MKLILIEGIDGTGKTTASKLLRWQLIQEGYTCEIFREPNGEFRKLLTEGNLTFEASLMLFLASRTELCNELKTNKSEFCILDRFSPSTLAYQGLKFDNSFLLSADEIVRNGITPDYTFLMEMSISNCVARIEKRENRIVDKQERKYLSSVKSRYRQAMADLNWNYCVLYPDSDFSTGKRMYDKLRKGGIIV